MSDSCESARKTRAICIIQNAIFLCFQVLLSFVPTIFHFLYFLHSFAGGSASAPADAWRGAAAAGDELSTI
jgi:hypothetical protein